MPDFKRFLGMDQRVDPSWPASVDPFGRKVQRFHDDQASFEFMAEGALELRPLVILQSLDFCCWPTETFCKTAQTAGFRVVSIRRPGFGANPPLTCRESQVRLIRNFLEELDLEDVILVGLGSSNPICAQVALSCVDGPGSASTNFERVII